jgi:hypothetical protein
MYSDPSLIRANPVRVELDDWEWDMVDALAAAEGEDRPTMLREMILEESERELRDMDALSD